MFLGMDSVLLNIEAAKIANAHDFIMQTEEGYNTNIADRGLRLSGGQRQRLSIARAVFKDPAILILDEATANIDTITEKLLSDILNNLPATTTRVIIAHRLNTIENADEIFFVNSGEVIRAGSFDHAMDMLLQGKRVS